MTSGRDYQLYRQDAKDSANASSMISQQVKKEKLALDIPKVSSDYVVTEFGIEDKPLNSISIQDTNVPGH